LQQEQTEQNGMNVSIKLKNRNEFIGKSGDLLLRRRKRSFRRAGGQKGQTYIGTTDRVKDKSGNVIENYRNDGSIMYSDEASGYRRMWNNTQKTGKEEMGIITDKGVLVLPSWKNKVTESEVEDYGYAFDKGNLIDPFNNKKLSFSGTIHTHPTLQTDQQGNVVHSWMGPSREDYTYFGNETPNIPFYVITADRRVHANISIDANTKTPLNLTKFGNSIYFESIVFGNFSLKNRGR